MSFLSHAIIGGWCFNYCNSRIWYCSGCLWIGMLHELRDWGGYASARSLRSVFTSWYKYAGECWDVGDNKRYTALSTIQLSAITGKRKIEIYFTSTTAIMTTFVPFEVRINEESTMETTVVKTQVENKHESRNRKALSWIIRKRWREVASRKRSAITSAVSNYIWMAMVDNPRFSYSQVSLNMAICWPGRQVTCCGPQTQNAWPIKIVGSTMNKTTTTKRGRLCCLGLIRMMVRRIERRANLI